MEFATDREAALYTTLKQVLQNHVGNHRLGYHETRTACISVLGYVLYVMMDAWEDAPALIERTITELHQHLDAPAGSAPLTLPTLHDYALRTAMSDEGYDLGTALATYLATSGIEHNMSVAATWRAYLVLLADVLAMPLHDGVQTLTEAHTALEALRDQLPGVMHMWNEAQ